MAVIVSESRCHVSEAKALFSRLERPMIRALHIGAIMRIAYGRNVALLVGHSAKWEAAKLVISLEPFTLDIVILLPWKVPARPG